MNTFASIEYRDFWDFPRMFLVRHEGQLFLFDCEFDEETEDFRDEYKVYLMPELTAEEIAGAWTKLPAKAIHYCGSVSTRSVKFDSSKRTQVDVGILEALTPALARVSA